MNDAIKIMLDKYSCHSIDDYENALKEIIQEIALLGLWRSKFFEKAAFYGGSALRILYGLNRFSEDLDFSLLETNLDFSFDSYSSAIESELKSFGFSCTVEKKEKKIKSNIDSVFVKAGTQKNMIIINIPNIIRKKMHSGKVMKIKLEIDENPPPDFRVEAKYLFLPIPFSVNTYALPYLFAGKAHALLCRSWGERVKGRDWYDLVWYAGKQVPVSLKHLEARMRQSGHFAEKEVLNEKKFKQMLYKKIESIDFLKAKKDVVNLLKDTSSLDLWSKDFFQTICGKIITQFNSNNENN